MKISIRLMVLALLFHACSGDITAQDVVDRAGEYLDAQARVNHFMGSVLIARDGEPVFRRSYGLANVEHDVPNRPETKFRLGSLTKQFTAAAILLLQERGRLDVDDPIGEYIENAPESWEDVTIHHLLTHTSGIPSFTSFPDYVETWMIPSRPEKTMLRFRDKPLEFKPGRKLSYSNSGYILLALIIENVSGMRYGEFLEENIFMPLGMTNSGHDSHAAILKHRASGYVEGENGLEHAPYHDMEIPTGGGDLYSTVDDMLIWDQALYGDRLLSDESRKAMLRSHESGYGYGMGIGKLHGRKIHSHAGGINGFVSQFIRFPEDRATVIILANHESSPVMDMGRDLAAILFGKDYELPRKGRKSGHDGHH